MKFRKIVLSSSCAVAALAATPAFAQGAAAGDDSGNDIVVTARRVAESAQSVPLAIEAFSQKDLTQRGVASAAELGKAVSGLSVNSDSGNPSLPSFSIRGRGQNYGSASGSVETYFADIPLSTPFQMPAFAPQFFDIGAFQVLKGPQGTLFGRNTTGGAVVIVPQAPKLGRTEGYVRVQGGSYNNFQAEGAINIPISDKAALRIAAFDWQRDGYMTSSPTAFGTTTTAIDSTTGKQIGSQRFNNINQTQVRVSLLVEPADNVTNTTIFSYERDKVRASGGGGIMQGKRVAPTASNPFGVTVFSIPTCGSPYCAYTDISLEKPASQHYLVSNTTTVALNDNLQVKNIAGFIHSDGYTNDAANTDGFDVALIDLPAVPRVKKNTQFTDELQLSGKAGIASYIVGAMYDNTSEPTSLATINPYSVSGVLAAQPGATTPPFNAPYNSINFQSTNIKQKSLFGSVTVTPVPALNITGGFRYSWISMSQVAGGAVYNVGSPQPTQPNSIFAKETTFKGASYNLGADYHINNDTMIYAGYRHGFKRGGFNPSQQDNSSFGIEKVDDFTIGAKTSFEAGGMRGRANVELFYDNYYGMQVAYLAKGAVQLETITLNVGKVNYQGVDANFELSPTNWLDLTASYVYNKAKIKRFVRAGDPTDLTVNKVPYNPENKYTLTARVHGDLPGGMGEAALMGFLTHQDKFYTGLFNTTFTADAVGTFFMNNVASFCAPNGLCGSTVPGYTTVDLRAELNHAFGSPVDLAVGVTNLTKKVYYVGSSSTLQYGFDGFSVGAPRMWTVELKTKF